MGRSIDVKGGFGWDLGVEIWNEDDWRYGINRELEEFGDIDDFYIKHSPLSALPPNPWDELEGKPENWYYEERKPGSWQRVDTQEFAEWKLRNNEAQDAYYEARTAAITACPFKLLNCYYEDFSHYLLVVHGSVLEGFESVTPLDLMSLSESVLEWTASALDIRDLLGLKPDVPPTFLIGASYG